MSKVIRILFAVVGFVSGFIIGTVAGTAIDFTYFPLSPSAMPVDGLVSFWRILLAAIAGSIIGLILGIWLPVLIIRRRIESKELRQQEVPVLSGNIWPPPPEA